MTYNDIQQVLENARSALERTKKGGRLQLSKELGPSPFNYISPTRHVLFFEFLTNGQAVPREIIHIFADSGWAPENEVYVKHGHFKSELCYAASYCHLSDFQFTGAESPVFQKLFKEKWHDERSE